MATIREIKQLLSVAAEQSRAGNELGAARLALIAQRDAALSCSRHAYALEFRAHGLAALAIKRAVGAPQRVRSELGQIAAESKVRFAAGGTQSRAAIRA